jgi:hypothetical protein
MRHAFATALVGVAVLCAPPFSAAIHQSNEQEIDRLFALCSKLGHKWPDENCFYRPEFWRESKSVAGRMGPEIIRAVMRRARRYPAHDQSEGPFLILLPLVALLPRTPTVELLHHYEQSNDKAEQLWAHEYLIEFNMADTAEAVRQYSRSND